MRFLGSVITENKSVAVTEKKNPIFNLKERFKTKQNKTNKNG